MPRNERTRRSVTMNRVFVASVIPEYIRPWTPTCWHTIWSWVSCGAALSHGARCGKGSGRACLEHLAEKHGGSTLEITNIAKFFPPWTVTRDVWHTTLLPDVSGVAVDALLFHEAGRRLVHRYRVYIDPFPHPALRDGLIPRLLSCVCRAIARLTHLRILIPPSGAPPGQVPTECFPEETAPPLSLIAAACRSRMRSPC